MKFINPILISIFFLTSHNSMAEIYKWVDEEGNVHYEQFKPGDVESETIKEPSSVDSEAAVEKLNKRQEMLKGYAKEREKEKKIKQHEMKEKGKAEENCKRSRELLEQLQSTRKLSLSEDADVVAAEAERQGEIEQVRKNIKKWCK